MKCVSFSLEQVVNDLVFSGSSDHCIYAHNIHVRLCVVERSTTSMQDGLSHSL